MIDLHERALAFEDDIEKYLLDDKGLLLTMLNMDTMKPFPKNYFNNKNYMTYPGQNWNDYGDLLHYENVGMVSGAYLAAMIWKYKATKNPEALEKAYRTFKGIKWLFDVSQKVEEGFYCKCYGGKISEEISSDQYIYTFSGLELFMEFADHDTKCQCIDMIEKMVRFWIRKKYLYRYFGQYLNWPLERFPGFAWLAYKYTQKSEFLDEYMRLCSLNEVKNKLPYGQRSWQEEINNAIGREPQYEFEKDSPLRLIKFSTENTQSGLLSLDIMLKHNAPFRELWMGKVYKMFERDKKAIAKDGYSKNFTLYNTETGKITEVKLPMNIPENPNSWKFFGFVGWVRSAMHSAMFAKAAVTINSYFPKIGGLEVAAQIMKQLSADRLHWFKDVDGKQFPHDLSWMSKVYSGDAVTHWIWAYWEATANYGGKWYISNDDFVPRLDTPEINSIEIK